MYKYLKQPKTVLKYEQNKEIYVIKFRQFSEKIDDYRHALRMFIPLKLYRFHLRTVTSHIDSLLPMPYKYVIVAL